MAAILQMMDDHESDLALVNVFSIVALGLFELFALKVNDIVLYLKSYS